MVIKYCIQCNKLVKDKYRELCWICRNKKYYTKSNERKRQNYDSKKKHEYYLKNKEKIKIRTSKRHIQRQKDDILYKLSCTLRHRTRTCLKYKSFKKTTKFTEYIGCSLEELKQHLEKQFKSGMSWNNYTSTGWNIDHIISLSSAKTEKGIYKLCHYTNLQPLWARDNLSKGNRF